MMKKYAIIVLSLFCYSAYAGRIHNAAREGNITKILEAVESGEDINTPYGYRHLTPLHCAVESGCEETVEFLCQLGNIDYNAQTKTGLTPLHIAVRNRSAAIVDILLRYGADVDPEWGLNGDRGTPLHCAVMNDDKEIVKLLCQAGAEPFMECVISYRTVDANKALGRTRVVKNAFDLARKSTQEIRDILNADYELDIS